ncbi:MAG: DUF3883 domain-containing protein [Oscillospiraceae bacterium]
MSNGLDLQKKLNCSASAEVLDEALRHTSYLQEKNTDVIEINKAYEILGSSLFDMMFYWVGYKYHETSLEYLRANIMNHKKSVIINIYHALGISDLVYLGRGEEINRHMHIYYDVLNKVLFTVYQSCGFQTVELLIHNYYNYNNRNELDYKTLLQEYVQAKKQLVSYKIIDESGPPHQRIFEAEVFALNRRVEGQGTSKKEAERDAAKRYYDLYKLPIPLKKVEKRSKLRSDLPWDVVAVRRSDLTNLINSLPSIKTILCKMPIHYIDACFTHKSILNNIKNNNQEIETMDSLKTLGAFVQTFAIDLYLYKHFDDYCDGDSQNIRPLRVKLISKEHADKIISDQSLKYLMCTTNLISSKNMKQDIYQSLVASLFLHAISDKRQNVFSEIHRLTEITLKDGINGDYEDYTQLLQQIVQTNSYEIYIAKEETKGSAHDIENLISLRIFSLEIKIIDFSTIGIGKTKKEARKNASKQIISKLNEMFNLNNEIDNLNISEEFILAIKRLFESALMSTKRKNYIHNKIIGGINLNYWSDYNAENILTNLYNMVLFDEIQKICSVWIKLYGKEEIKKLISNHYLRADLWEIIGFKDNDDDNQTDTVNENQADIVFENNSLKENDTQALQKESDSTTSSGHRQKKENQKRSIKKDRVFTRVYYFGNNECPYCHSELRDTSRYIQAYKNNIKLNISAKCDYCYVCDIIGLQKSKLDQFATEGYQVNEYRGSPVHFQSTIIKLVLLKEKTLVLFQDNTDSSQFKKRRIITPEELEKRLERNKKIGMDGEKFVYEREVDYLSRIGQENLSKNVQWVSKENTAAGYDIASFSADGEPIYIEVKSTTGASKRFQMSINEWEVAQQLQENYFIYRVYNLNSITQLIKLPNPVKLFEQNEIDIEPSGYNVGYQ